MTRLVLQPFMLKCKNDSIYSLDASLVPENFLYHVSCSKQHYNQAYVPIAMSSMSEERFFYL